jgi:hypothetical protein
MTNNKIIIINYFKFLFNTVGIIVLSNVLVRLLFNKVIGINLSMPENKWILFVTSLPLIIIISYFFYSLSVKTILEKSIDYNRQNSI